MDTIRHILADNLAHVESRLADACRRAGRSREDVTLVGVTKSVSASIAAELFALGVRDLGEGRPQELWRKATLLPADVRWHLVGHLQRNKIDRTLPLAHRIHSIDSVRLLDALEAMPGESPINVFLEVNCSGEANKQGFSPEEVRKIGTIGDFWEGGKSKTKMWDEIKAIERQIGEGMEKPHIKRLAEYVHDMIGGYVPLEVIERNFGYSAEEDSVQGWIDRLLADEWAEEEG